MPSYGKIGKLIKLGAKEKGVAEGILRGGMSRAAAGLKGTTFKGGTIKTITKGKGNIRHIVLEDETVYPVYKDVVSNLMRRAGTSAKMGELASKVGESDQLLQAMKSAKYHKARIAPLSSRTLIEANYRNYVGQMEQAELQRTPYSLVKDSEKTFSMPRPYAEVLERAGQLKILKHLE